MVAQSEVKPDVPLPLPPGMITMWYGDPATPPTGWAICDGNNGTPDLRGRVPVGLKSTDANFDTLGETGGAKTHQLTVAEMPTHNHNVSVSNSQINSYNGSPGSTWRSYASQQDSPRVSHGHTATVSESNRGSGDAHNNLQPYCVLVFIMKL